MASWENERGEDGASSPLSTISIDVGVSMHKDGAGKKVRMCEDGSLRLPSYDYGR